jgi:hypothetical protein
MSRTLLQQALDALKHHRQSTTFQFQETNAAIKALEQELAKPEQAKYSDIVSDGGLDPRNKFDAQPEQEPEIVRRVKRYMGKRRESVGSPHITAKECIALANWIDSILTAPPRKPWQGLTDDEIKEVLDLNVAPWSLSGVALQHVMDDARALEAKLKEKNNAV